MGPELYCEWSCLVPSVVDLVSGRWICFLAYPNSLHPLSMDCSDFMLTRARSPMSHL